MWEDIYNAIGEGVDSLGRMLPSLNDFRTNAYDFGQLFDSNDNPMYSPDYENAFDTGAMMDLYRAAPTPERGWWDTLNQDYLQPVGSFLQSPGGQMLGGLGMAGLSYLDASSANKKARKAQKKMLAQRQAVLDQMNARAAKYDAPIMGAINERGPARADWGVGVPLYENNSLAAIKPGTAPGYLSGFAEGGYAQGGTSGQSDKIPAMLSDGEFVIDADTVAALGDGNNAAGASALERMRQNIRKHKRSAPPTKIPPKAKTPEQYMKGK